MSERKEITMAQRLQKAMRRATQSLFERKTKLGEEVVIADSEGRPTIVSAEEALQILKRLEK